MLNKLSSGFLGGTVAGGIILIVLLVFCGIKICNSSKEDIQSIMKENFIQFGITFIIFIIALIGLVVCLLIACIGKSEEESNKSTSFLSSIKDTWKESNIIGDTFSKVKNRFNDFTISQILKEIKSKEKEKEKLEKERDNYLNLSNRYKDDTENEILYKSYLSSVYDKESKIGILNKKIKTLNNELNKDDTNENIGRDIVLGVNTKNIKISNPIETSISKVELDIDKLSKNACIYADKSVEHVKLAEKFDLENDKLKAAENARYAIQRAKDSIKNINDIEFIVKDKKYNIDKYKGMIRTALDQGKKCVEKALNSSDRARIILDTI